MKGKTLALPLILIVLCSLAARFHIPTVDASFHISPDGYISGTDKIRRDGDVYTFTGNIDMDIKVEKSNIIIDGAGFKLLKGAVAGNWGISFSFGVHDVTIKNLMMTGFDRGIMLSGSGNTVTGCTLTDCYEGILLSKANNNTIADSTFVNSTLRFVDSSNNRLRNNRFENSWIGTSWQNSYNDVDSSNTNDGKPVYYLVNQHDLVISPIDYPEIGCLILIGCTGITIKDIIFSSQKTNGGVTMTYTSDSKIINNTFADLLNGIVLHECCDIVLAGNYITNNGVGIAIHPDGDPHSINIIINHIENNEMGISLGGSHIEIYQNNFVNNTEHVYDMLWHPFNRAPTVTYGWDNDSQGNFWSDHNATDGDGDGIADTPYVINQWSNNIDRYPLMEPTTQIEFDLPVEPESMPSPEDTPEAALFLTVLITAASVASIAITIIALIGYFRKRKHMKLTSLKICCLR